MYVGVSRGYAPYDVVKWVRPLVEQDVTSPTGHTIRVTASWETIDADLKRTRAIL